MHSHIEELVDLHGNDPLKLLETLGGFYEVIKEGCKRLTPLVGYAAKYHTEDGKELQYVGEVYANFAKLEEHPYAMHHLTRMLLNKLKLTGPVVFIGPAMGGISVAQFLAFHASQKIKARYACAEKVVTHLKTDTLREQSELQFARHTVNAGETAIIAEDVMNNFATTKELIALIEKQGAKVGAIVGLLNRSMTIDSVYMNNNKPIPVISLVRKPFQEYKQEDFYVIEDIAAENYVLKPKNEWGKLKTAIEMLKR